MFTEFEILTQISVNECLSWIIFNNSVKLKIIAELDIIKYFYKCYQQIKKQSSISINKWVCLINQNLEDWMLRVVNIILHLCSESESHWSQFCKIYNQYSQKNLDLKWFTNFCICIQKLREHVLECVKIVVCTLNNLRNTKLYMMF